MSIQRTECGWRPWALPLSLSLSLCLSSPPLFSPSWPPLLHTSACRFDLSPLSSWHEHRGILWDYGSTRYYLQRTYVTFRTAYYCDYRRIMRRPSRSTIYYWIAIIRIDRTSMRLDVLHTCCCGKCNANQVSLYAENFQLHIEHNDGIILMRIANLCTVISFTVVSKVKWRQNEGFIMGYILLYRYRKISTLYNVYFIITRRKEIRWMQNTIYLKI